MMRQFINHISLHILLSLALAKFAVSQDVDRNKGIYLNFSPQITIHTSVRFQLIIDDEVYDYSDDQPGTFSRGFHCGAGYFLLKKQLAVGVGIAIENNEEYRAKYWPVYLDTKYFLKPQRNTPFGFINYGSMLGNNGNQIRGYLLSIGAGQKVFFTNKLAATFSLAYSLRKAEYSNPNIIYIFGPAADSYRLRAQGFELKIGLFF